MFYSMESNHLRLWGKEVSVYERVQRPVTEFINRRKKKSNQVVFACSQVRNGYVQSVMDEETQSSAIELHGINTRYFCEN